MGKKWDQNQKKEHPKKEAEKLEKEIESKKSKNTWIVEKDMKEVE
jgi:hypothetical protein